MNTPYFNVKLYSNVGLYPNQMDNDIYKHLKNNLIQKLQGKCYKSYGYITKIYKIDERSDGKLIAEDSFASAYYNVKFSCRLCKPLKDSIIVCEVMKISKAIIYLKNGPVNVFILDSKNDINHDNFVYDERRNALIANIGGNKGITVVEGVFLKVNVVGIRIEHGASEIVVIGTLEGLASKNESNESIMQKDDLSEEFKEYDEHAIEKTD